MATIYDLKPKFQALLRPVTSALAHSGITANGVTLVALMASAIYGIALFATHLSSLLLIGLPLFLFFRMALNAIDGMLAREHGQKSSFGAVLNEVSDVVSDGVLYLPFAILPGVSGVLVVIVVFLGFVAEFAGVVAVQVGATRRYDGPFGKSDRAFFFGALALIAGVGVSLDSLGNIALIIAAALGLLTIINRTRAALAEVSA